MAGQAPKKPNFTEILEKGAQVDDIFRDTPAPKGSDPFQEQGIVPLAIEEATTSVNVAEPVVPGMENTQINFVDNDSLFCINRKYAAVSELFKLITRENISFGQMISEILRISMDQIKSEAGSFLEIDHNNQCMFFRAATGRSSENLLNFTVPLGQGIAGFVCETQQPMALSSIDDSSVYLRSISDAVGFEAKNMIAYPVVIRGVSFGCIELLNRLGEPQFTDADREVMATICEYGARIIENRLLLAAMSKELITLKTGREPGEEAA
jgi:GAF domain-containing protein